MRSGGGRSSPGTKVCGRSSPERLELEVEAAEPFEVAAVVVAPPFARERSEILLLAELGDVGGERVDLEVDQVGDIDIEVGVVGVPEEDFAHLVRFEAGGKVSGEVEVVAGSGVDGIEGGGAGGTVVRVVDETIADDDVGWVVGKDGVWAKGAEVPDDAFHEFA